MAVCTFFGHHDCPPTVKPALRAAIIDLIENHAADTFYVGNQGHFDFYARSILQELAQIYPHIRYTVVLAYLPKNEDFPCPTLFPDGIESVPKRFAISFRNKWMLKHTDFVLSYVTHGWGGAAQFVELAEKQQKIILSLADS